MRKRLYSVKIIEYHIHLLYRYVVILWENANLFLQNVSNECGRDWETTNV